MTCCHFAQSKRLRRRLYTLAANVRASDDPEGNYLSAANLSYCGQTAQAMRLLSLAVQGNYCSYPAIDLTRLRKRSRHARICRDPFRSNHMSEEVRDGTPASSGVCFPDPSVKILYFQMSLSPPREFVPQARAFADSCVTRIGLPASDQRESHATGERFDTPFTPVRALSAMKETGMVWPDGAAPGKANHKGGQ